MGDLELQNYDNHRSTRINAEILCGLCGSVCIFFHKPKIYIHGGLIYNRNNNRIGNGSLFNGEAYDHQTRFQTLS